MHRPPEPLRWVRYDPGAALFGFLRVSPAAELAHRRLADYHWQTGDWASVLHDNAATLARVDPAQWPAVLAELPSLGWRVRHQRLSHHGVQQVREEAVSALRSVRKRCRNAARQRWDGQGDTRQDRVATSSGPAGPSNSPPMHDACMTHCSGNAPAMPEPMHDACMTHCSGNAPAMPNKSKSKSNSTVHNSTTLNAINPNERLTFMVSARKKPGQAEKEFLKTVEETFALGSPKLATDELLNWGGWWRNRFRENPAKARIVLADLASMIREGRIHSNPGAAAADLWTRLP